ncbi:MAG: DUF4157 domain-containing protein [Chitinophagaceae bacterium]|nr:MAG: DUF4157 domain-containing protein [Chitinophagaceae bacterium]
MNYRIRENSTLARLAAWKLGTPKVAMVLGSTIHLYNTSAKEFLANERWVKHEMKHIEQYRRYGLIPFLWKYLIESIRHGYYNNRYEAEARAAETDH